MSAYVLGEQGRVTCGRRHLVAAGVPKVRIVFSGFWKAARLDPEVR
ncbi:hypothetical protein [Schaalia suimastitidis]|nr:hypothetical protein [Schaalia suimastitidis]